MEKQYLSEELKRMKKLAGLIKEGEEFLSENFDEYSDDALTDMIINLSRFENNEEEIQGVKDELERRKKQNISEESNSSLSLKDMNVGDTIKVSSSQDLAPFNLKVMASSQGDADRAVSDLPELEGMMFLYNGISITRIK